MKPERCLLRLGVRSLNGQKEESHYSHIQFWDDSYVRPDRHFDFYYFGRLEGSYSDHAFSHNPLNRNFLVCFAMSLLAFLFVLSTFIACAILPPLDLDKCGRSERQFC